jgi:hypothetical protein
MVDWASAAMEKVRSIGVEIHLGLKLNTFAGSFILQPRRCARELQSNRPVNCGHRESIKGGGQLRGSRRDSSLSVALRLEPKLCDTKLSFSV